VRSDLSAADSHQVSSIGSGVDWLKTRRVDRAMHRSWIALSLALLMLVMMTSSAAVSGRKAAKNHGGCVIFRPNIRRLFGVRLIIHFDFFS